MLSCFPRCSLTCTKRASVCCSVDLFDLFTLYSSSSLSSSFFFFFSTNLLPRPSLSVSFRTRRTEQTRARIRAFRIPIVPRSRPQKNKLCDRIPYANDIIYSADTVITRLSRQTGRDLEFVPPNSRLSSLYELEIKQLVARLGIHHSCVWYSISNKIRKSRSEFSEYPSLLSMRH